MNLELESKEIGKTDKNPNETMQVQVQCVLALNKTFRFLSNLSLFINLDLTALGAGLSWQWWFGDKGANM